MAIFLAEIRGLVTIAYLDGLHAISECVLLDGAKALYPDILALLEPRLRLGALVIADNADDCPDYLEYIRSSVNGYISTPFAGDIELSMRAA